MSAQPQENGPASSTAASFWREQKHLGARCDFPKCERHAELGARMCEYHALVRLSASGSWVNDSHPEGGHG